jgi:hypothetical protein
MCDYSLQHVASRPAVVGEKLVTRNFGTGTRGFSSPEKCDEAVCILPGTELAFSAPITINTGSFLGAGEKKLENTAIFRQINKDQPFVHHDALEFPNGEQILLTFLSEGQEATVLQLPAAPKTAEEVNEQERLAVVA